MAKLDPRIYKTLRNIDEALLATLKERPFHRITIDQLCKQAMINRSTFYKYYADKYALLDDYLTRSLDEFRETVKTDFINADLSNVDDPYYSLLFRETAAFLFSHRDRYQTLWNAAIDRNIFREMIAIVEERILEKLAEGGTVTRPAAARQLYASFFASNMMTLICWWFQNEGQVNENTVVEIMTSNMKRGLFYTFKQMSYPAAN